MAGKSNTKVTLEQTLEPPAIASRSRWVWVFVLVWWCGIVSLYVTLLAPRPAWKVFSCWIDFLISFRVDNVETMKDGDYSGSVSIIVGIWTSFAVLWSAVRGYLHRRGFMLAVQQQVAAAEQRFNRRQGFDVEPVQKGTKGDLIWMTKYYKDAGRIFVFAGSFDWLDDHKPLKKIIVKLARDDKITFISYQGEDVVRNALIKMRVSNGSGGSTNLYDALKKNFYFNSGLKITCSLVSDKLDAQTLFLYRSPSEAEEHAFNACVLLDSEHSKLLVKIIEDLIKARYWGVKTGEATPGKQDARCDLHEDDGCFQV